MSTLESIDPKEEYESVTEELYNYIITRDDSLCQMCGKIGSDLHHIDYKSSMGKNKANNLILLCKDCHTGNNGVHGVNKNVKLLLLKRVKNNEKRLRDRML